VAERFHSELDRVDLFINNAGIVVGTPAEELEIENWIKVLNVNLWSVIYLVIMFLLKMLERSSAVISISSLS